MNAIYWTAWEMINLFDLMKQFRGNALFSYGRRIERIGTLFGLVKPDAKLTADQCQQLSEMLNTVDKGAEYLDLAVSKEASKELLLILEKKDSYPSMITLQPLLIELNKRIEAELKAHMYLCVSKEKAQFYKNPLENWDTTEAAFPITRYDIEEASKCLALSRNTAAVFHLMRVMGAGVTALGKSLDEPILDASHNLTWDNVLSRCVKELGEKFSGKSPEWQTDKEFYAKATATLLAVKDAWRNPNMHEVGQKYTDEEAFDIYRAVRAFMRHLATKLKESL